MALINCPECGKEVSDTAKKCPNCGFKFKKEKDLKKRKKIVISTIIIAVVLVVGVIVFAKQKSREVEKAIQTYTNTESIESLVNAKKQYDKLPFIAKVFVSGKDKITNCTLEVTPSNFKELFEIKVDFYDEEVKTRPGLFGTDYAHFCKCHVVLQPKATFTCEDVYATIDLDLANFNNDILKNIRIEDNGHYEKDIQINTDYIITTLGGIKPYFIEDEVIISGCSGTISFK